MQVWIFLFTRSENSSNQNKADSHNQSTVSGCVKEGALGKYTWVQESSQNFWLELRCITFYKINTAQTVVKLFVHCSNFLSDHAQLLMLGDTFLCSLT